MSESIPIGAIAPHVQYVADGVQAAFTYPFPIFDPADLEVRVNGPVQAAGYDVGGAADPNGGEVTFAVPPPAGASVMLRRHLAVARTTAFQDNGVLRARTLNAELDYQVAVMQELSDEIGGSLQVDPSEIGSSVVLPMRAARANNLLGFDAVGGVTVYGRGDGQISVPFPGSVPRSVEDKLAEVLTARDFGATGDGSTDDGPALQAAMYAAAASGKRLEIGEGTFRTTMPLNLPGAAAGLTMRGLILYAGPPAHAALTLGDGGAARNAAKLYQGLRVLRASQSDWSNEADIGILIRNLDESVVEVRQADCFTIGVQLLGDERGFEDTTLSYGRIVDNKVGLDIRTLTASAWNNCLRHIGGHFACSSGTNPTQDRFGIRFSAAPGAYDRHNTHLFIGPGFELQRQGTPGRVAAIPFLMDVADGRSVSALGIRMEACSPYVARHTGGFNDVVYEVAYVGTYGFLGCGIDYTATATRAGGTVLPRHQATAAIGSPRLVADAGNARNRAFRWNASAVGFAGMAVLSGNPAGPPSTLNGFCFPGLDSFILNGDSVTLPTSRAIAFVVDAANCREFFLAAEGLALRPMAMQFDASENVLTNTAPLLMSNMNVVWQGAPSYWWEGNANLDDLSGGYALNRLQRVTLNPACRYAVIGVRGGVATAELRALRLYTAAHQAPPVLAGGGRRWGSRELTASFAFSPGTINSGASLAQTILLPDAAPGDFAQAAWSNATLLPFMAQVNASSPASVSLRIWNPTGGNVPLDPGTALVRVVKARL
jgi:Phage T7 tail fibre protein